MEYEKLDEKTPVQAPKQVARQDYRENADIKKARTIILVLVSIQLIFALFYLIEQSIELGRYNNLPKATRDNTVGGALIGNVIVAIVSVVYLTLFIIFVARYMRIAILVFAWLGIIQLICALIVFILAIIAVVIVSSSANRDQADIGIALSVVVMILALLSVICIIVTIVYAFKLARLIKQQEAYQNV